MIAEADVNSLDSSLDIISAIGPISPIKLGTYYDTSIIGCGRKCPCRTWINCRHYNYSRWKELRGDEELIWSEIHEWYENFFKYKHGLPDTVYPNG